MSKIKNKDEVLSPNENLSGVTTLILQKCNMRSHWATNVKKIPQNRGKQDKAPRCSFCAIGFVSTGKR